MFSPGDIYGQESVGFLRHITFFVPCKESQNEIVTLLGTDVQVIRRLHEKNIPKCKSYPHYGDTVQARVLRDLGANRDIRTVPQVQRPWDKPKPRNGAR